MSNPLAIVDRLLEAAVKIVKRRRLAKIERNLEKAMQHAFREQGKAFATRFRTTFKDRLPMTEVLREADPINNDDWESIFWMVAMELEGLFVDPIQEAVTDAMSQAAEVTNSSAGAGLELSFSLENPRAVKYVQERGAENVKRINETTRDYIRTVIKQGVEQGWSVDKMAKAITQRYEQFAVGQPQEHIQSRAHLVAAFEAGQAYEVGNFEMAQQIQDAGYPMEKYWQNVRDSKVSPECRGNTAAGWIPLMKAFPSGHLHPLAHPA